MKTKVSSSQVSFLFVRIIPSSTGGGIVLLIRKNIAYKEIDNLATPNLSVELCGLRITNTNPALNIYVCYRVPGDTLSQEQWEVVFSNFDLRCNNVFLGDFNAHHELWNCRKTDLNGKYLLECVKKAKFFIHNTDMITHIDKTSKSNLDLVITSSNLKDRVETQAHCDTGGSDHYPIYIQINTQKSYYLRKSFKIRSIRTDWQIVSVELDKAYSHFLSSDYCDLPPNKKYDTYVKIISDSIKNNTPTKKVVNIKTHRNPVPWWDEECQEIKDLRNKAFKTWERNKDEKDFIEFKRLRALARRIFKNKKRESFKRFTESLHSHTDIKYVWNTSKILKNKWVKVTPSHFSENLQMENRIKAIDKICPPGAPTNPDYLPTCQENEFLESEFTYAEFNLALFSRKLNS